jgi:hypothetical protein
MKTVLIIVVILVVLLIVGLVFAAIAAGRFGRRSYQRYTGLEHQRAAAKQARDVGVDRLKEAERHLVSAQRDLISRRHHEDAQAIERLRVRLSTAADRHRYATHGYAPLGDPNPIREAELAELQARDAETIGDAQMICDLAKQTSAASAAGATPDLGALGAAVDHLVATLDQRKTLSYYSGLVNNCQAALA